MKLIRILSTEQIDDSQHDGESLVSIINCGKGNFCIYPGMKIAQIKMQTITPVNEVNQNE